MYEYMFLCNSLSFSFSVFHCLSFLHSHSRSNSLSHWLFYSFSLSLFLFRSSLYHCVFISSVLFFNVIISCSLSYIAHCLCLTLFLSLSVFLYRSHFLLICFALSFFSTTHSSLSFKPISLYCCICHHSLSIIPLFLFPYSFPTCLLSVALFT